MINHKHELDAVVTGLRFWPYTSLTARTRSQSTNATSEAKPHDPESRLERASRRKKPIVHAGAISSIRDIQWVRDGRHVQRALTHWRDGAAEAVKRWLAGQRNASRSRLCLPPNVEF